MMLMLAEPSRLRDLSVRLAGSDADIAAAQKLRWEVFYGDMGAVADERLNTPGLDCDPYDAVCDHLLVEDRAGGEPVVIGTYRLLRQSVATRHQGFYTADEFDLGSFLASADGDGELLELGRSCVAPAYRDAGTIQFLWRGIAQYLMTHGIGRMFGCASFPGTDPQARVRAGFNGKENSVERMESNLAARVLAHGVARRATGRPNPRLHVVHLRARGRNRGGKVRTRDAETFRPVPHIVVAVDVDLHGSDKASNWHALHKHKAKQTFGACPYARMRKVFRSKACSTTFVHAPTPD